MWQAILLVNGHEPKSYETSRVIAGLFLNFIIVKIKGPKKTFEIEIEKNLDLTRLGIYRFNNCAMMLFDKRG